jgi:hypothetical protein
VVSLTQRRAVKCAYGEAFGFKRRLSEELGRLLRGRTQARLSVIKHEVDELYQDRNIAQARRGGPLERASSWIDGVIQRHEAEERLSTGFGAE